MEVYKSRFSLVFIALVSGGMTMAILLACLKWLQEQNWVMIVLGLVALLAVAATCVQAVRSLMHPKPLAAFSTTGITNRTGDFLAWTDVKKAYVWSGVLFVKDYSGSDWFLRIDPFDVGGHQLRDAVSYIHKHAPIESTKKLK